MATIKAISDLRDYNKVLKNCSIGEPVYLTKNGRGIYVVVDIEEYEYLKSLSNLSKNNSEFHKEI